MSASLSMAPPGTSQGRPVSVVRVFDDRPFRADGDLLALAFADDGSLWSVEDPGVLRRWDVSGQRQIEWYPLSDLENLWVFSKDARVLASASDEVSLWSVSGGQLLTVLPQPSWVTALDLTADAAQVATGHEEGTVCVWDALNDDLIQRVSAHQGPVSALAFSPDGRQLATAGEDRVIRLWEVQTGKELSTLVGPHDRIPALVWHPQGHRLYASNWDTSVWVWDVARSEPIILLNSHASQIQAMAISPDGQRLAVADSERALHIWDLTTHRTVQIIRASEGDVRCLVFAPHGKTLTSGGMDRVVHVWGLTGLQEPARPHRHITGADTGHPPRKQEIRTGLALYPDGTHLASIGTGQGIRVWGTASERKVLDLDPTEEILSVAVSADGQIMAGGGADQRVRLWDCRSGRQQAILEGPPLAITAMAFAPQAPVLATASISGCDVWLWNTTRAEPLLVIPDAADGASVEGLAFHPQGDLLAIAGIDWLATGGGDGVVRLWDVVQPHRGIRFPGGARALAFHPAGRLLASATLFRTVRVWDVVTGEMVAEYEEHDDAVNGLAYSPDGRLLASAGDDRTVRLWDIASGRCLGLTELDTQVKALTFSPDGTTLFTANGNTSCYQLRTQRLIHR